MRVRNTQKGGRTSAMTSVVNSGSGRSAGASLTMEAGTAAAMSTSAGSIGYHSDQRSSNDGRIAKQEQWRTIRLFPDQA